MITRKFMKIVGSDTNEVDYHVDPEEMSKQKKEMMMLINNKSPELPYPMIDKKGRDGVTYHIYDIPEDKRQEVLNECYPFNDTPSIDDTKVCLHESKPFKVKDYILLRYADRNMLASPYFLQSGGMVLDWIDEEEA